MRLSAYWSLRLMLLVAAMSCLMSCALVSGNCKYLMVKPYDQVFTLKLVKEIGATPLDSATRTYLVDQTNLRDQIRACRGDKG